MKSNPRELGAERQPSELSKRIWRTPVVIMSTTASDTSINNANVLSELTFNNVNMTSGVNS